jgi:hypothetical protein
MGVPLGCAFSNTPQRTGRTRDTSMRRRGTSGEDVVD